jgi:hypothetical protein
MAEIRSMDKDANARRSMIPWIAAAVDISATVCNFTDPTQLYIGTTGDVKVDMAETGTAITFKNVPSGGFLPIACSKVYKADTTATNIVGLR